MIDFIPFRAVHAYKMDWIEKSDFLYSLKQTPQFFEMLEAQGESETMIKYINDDCTEYDILGVITVTRESECHCCVNMSMSAALQADFSKDVLIGLRNYVKNLSASFPRVSAYGKATNDKLTKLMNSIGFTPETVMRKFGHEAEDYILFSKVWED